MVMLLSVGCTGSLTPVNSEITLEPSPPSVQPNNRIRGVTNAFANKYSYYHSNPNRSGLFAVKGN